MAHIDPRTLESFVPLLDLDKDALAMLSRTVTAENAPAGRQLAEHGATDPWSIYLLQGRVRLEAADGIRRVIDGGSDEAKVAIAQLKPRMYAVTTLTPVTFLRIEDALIERLLKGDDADASAEIEGDELPQSQLFYDIFQDLNNDTLKLPNLPDIAVRIRKVAEEDRADADTLAKIVETNPGIAAKLIKVANSPLYRGRSPVTKCAPAIVRLGTKATKQLVFSLTMEELFRTKSAALKRRMLQLWEHSTRVAAISFVLARMTPGFDPEHALLAGLLHDIGVLPILSYAQKYPYVVSNPEELDSVINRMRGELGGMILRKWRFPKDFLTTAVEAEMWHRDPVPTPDYCDIIQIAQLHSFVGTEKPPHAPRIDELPAYSKLALGQLSPTLSLKVLDEAHDRISEALRLLVG